jgi:hypothetical protein
MDQLIGDGRSFINSAENPVIIDNGNLYIDERLSLPPVRVCYHGKTVLSIVDQTGQIRTDDIRNVHRHTLDEVRFQAIQDFFRKYNIGMSGSAWTIEEGGQDEWLGDIQINCGDINRALSEGQFQISLEDPTSGTLTIVGLQEFIEKRLCETYS